VTENLESKQINEFKEAARELSYDEDEVRRDERLREVPKQKRRHNGLRPYVGLPLSAQQ
jgi:hypothetical protein